MSGSSFRLSTGYCRPPVCSAISVSRPGPGSFFRRPAARADRLVNADRIDLDVRFPHQVLDFAFGVAAAVVAAVGNHQQRLARILGLLHFVQRQVNGIQQRRPAFGLGEGQPVLDLFQVRREGLDQFGAIVELHQEKLVLRDWRS